MKRSHFLSLAVLYLFTSLCSAQETAAKAKTVWLMGDSTVHNTHAGLAGWGDHFSLPGLKIVNKAMGGRSSRTFMTEGRWKDIEGQLQPGDLVLMQFGHNDNGPMDTGRARASIKGNGDEQKEVTLEATGKKETVHSYGWYLRQYIAGAKAKGATPVVLSLVPRNIWKDGKVVRATNDYTSWAKAAAEQGGAQFFDLNAAIADKYEAKGKAKIKEFFTEKDHTHTNADGAKLNAATVTEGLEQLKLLTK
jgi:lysophospholipase L1-like esterase